MRAKKTNGYRSKFEDTVAKYLTKKRIKFEYEKTVAPYTRRVPKAYCDVCGGSSVVNKHTYTPDFHINGRIFLEAKGKFAPRDRTKLLAVLNTSGTINRSNFRLLFMQDNFTTKKKRERYTEWASRNGIRSAVWGNIPKGFFK